MIRIAIIDESPFVQKLLTAYLSRASGIEVVGAAGTASDALQLVERALPDVITLGVEMPDMRGTELLSLLKLASPQTAVVMVSGVSRNAAAITLKAMQQGAEDFHLKFMPDASVDPQLWERELLTKVRAVHQRRLPVRHRKAISRSPVPGRTLPIATPVDSHNRLIVIGGSTGGILALERILAHLNPSSQDAILIAQHLPAHFTQSLLIQLKSRSRLPLVEAVEGGPLSRGTITLAPGGTRLRVTRRRERWETLIESNPSHQGCLPDIDQVMRSAAESAGPQAVGVLLSGMGSDGTEGLTAIFEGGGDTMVQDAASCVIFGMPRRAIERQVVRFIGSPEQLARRLNRDPLSLEKVSHVPASGSQPLSPCPE